MQDRREEAYLSGRAWHNLAERYRLCADIVVEELFPPNTEIDITAWLATLQPLCSLYGHAIELNLKGFLIAQEGTPPKTHDLLKLHSRALEKGLTLHSAASSILRDLNTVYVKTQGAARNDYRARYPVEPGNNAPTQLLFPNFLQWASREIAKAVSEQDED